MCGSGKLGATLRPMDWERDFAHLVFRKVFLAYFCNQGSGRRVFPVEGNNTRSMEN